MTDGPGLVIFDCDGVLVDSEPLAARVDAEMLGELGWAISVEEVAERFIGRSSADVRTVVESHLGRTLPEGWEAEYRRRFFQVAADELTPVAGVTDVVDRLIDAGIPVCVGSNSSRERVTWSLQVTGLLSRFEGHIFSGQEVPHPKPAPDLFVTAAAAMGVAPAQTVVVEDSHVGAQAARRAGMATFGYAGGLTRAERLTEAGATVFTAMADLPGLLGVP